VFALKILILMFIAGVIFTAVKLILNIPEIKVLVYGKETITKKNTAKKASKVDLDGLHQAEEEIKSFNKKVRKKTNVK